MRLKRMYVGVMLTAVVLLGAIACGPGLPTLSAVAGRAEIAAVANGYQWTTLGGTEIADAAFVPARGLKVHALAPGTLIRLEFSSLPQGVRMEAWRDGRPVPGPRLTGLAFRAPSRAGTYVYQIHASYGTSYVDYDFAIAVRGRTGTP